MVRIPSAHLQRLTDFARASFSDGDAMTVMESLVATTRDLLRVRAARLRCELPNFDADGRPVPGPIVISPTGTELPEPGSEAYLEAERSGRLISITVEGEDHSRFGVIEVVDPSAHDDTQADADAAPEAFDAGDRALLELIATLIAGFIDTRRRLDRSEGNAAAFGAERARLTSLLDAVPSGIVAIAADRSPVFANSMALAIMGVPGGSVTDLGGPDAPEIVNLDGTVRPRAEQGIERARTLGEARPAYVSGLRFPDGHVTWVLTNTSVVQGAEGEVAYVITAFTDITQQHELQMQLAASAARLRASERVSAVGSWQLDEDASVLTWSDGMYTVLGIDPAAPLGDEPYTAVMHPDDRTRVRLAVDHANTTRSPLSLRHRVIRPDDGREITIALVGEPMPDGTMIGTCRDITVELNEQERLRRAQQLEMVGRLAGGLAHDLNNFLTVMAGHAELLSLTVSGAAMSSVEAIAKATDRAAVLTRQLLEVGRREILQPEVLDINTVLTELQTTFRQVLPGPVELELVLDPTLPSVEIDGGKLEQVLLNLVLNAADAVGGSGRVRFETSLVHVAEAVARRTPELNTGTYVCVAVVDDGAGMSREVLARALEPFFTTKPRDRGSGLGLSTSYGILKQSGGHLTIDSSPGDGTTVTVYLPVSTERPPGRALPGGSPEPISAVVLVAEDDDQVRELTAVALEQAGCVVLTAKDGPTAFDLASGHHGTIDVLVTDVSMPGYGGRDLADRVLAVRPGVQVLYMSGYTENSAVLRDIVEANVHFLGKPFTVSELVARVADVVRGNTTDQK
jgi:PAS domain S-box-containing protein